MGRKEHNHQPRFGAAGLTIVLLCLVGCKGSGKYPVKGELQWEDGRPLTELAGSEVMFSSQQLAKSSRGLIKDDATFELRTDTPADGAYPGEYIVTVSQPHPEPERPEKRKPIVALDYEDPQRTPLKATVKAETNSFTFKLKPIKRAAK